MTCTRLLILRHGQSEGNRDGRFNDAHEELTALGHRQAHAAATAICREPLDAIYTSDLPRALETTISIERASGRAAVRTVALRERSLGEYEGVSLEELSRSQPEFWRALMRADLHAAAPGGESRDDCGRRVRPFVDEVLRAHPGGRVLLVSHRMLIDHLLRLLLGLHEVASPCAILETDNGGLHRLEFRGERLFVIGLNDVAHLVGVGGGAPHADGRDL